MTRHSPHEAPSCHATGDILLAAALMAIGIPLDDADPCSIIHKEGRTYGSWQLLPQDAEFKITTAEMMLAWDGVKELRADDPFQWLMEFIAARPAGVSSVEDWLGWAHQHLRDLGFDTDSMPARLQQIADFVAKNPDSRPAHVFAFVHCRDLAFLIFRRAKHAVMQTRGRSHTMIDARLPRRLRSHLLSRLEDHH